MLKLLTAFAGKEESDTAASRESTSLTTDDLSSDSPSHSKRART